MSIDAMRAFGLVLETTSVDGLRLLRRHAALDLRDAVTLEHRLDANARLVAIEGELRRRDVTIPSRESP